MQTHLPVASKLCTVPLCTSSLTLGRQEGSRGKLEKYGKLWESKLGALCSHSHARTGCFFIKTFRGGLNEKPQLSHSLECFAPELETPFPPSYLPHVAGIMTRALAAIDDMVTETIWWFPINNLDGLRRSLEQEGAGRQEKKREKVRGWDRREHWISEGKGKHEMSVGPSASHSHTGAPGTQIPWQSVPQAS